jgi:predicted nucleotidyltransferase component of viral defense system
MLSLREIEQQYTENLRPYKRNILREYVQYKILEIIFASESASKLAFLGGTALRIVYNQTRFSEDLDFDNFGMSETEFTELSSEVKKGLELLGYECEITIVAKGAYRCNIRLPEILFLNELSPLREEEVLVQIDTLAHEYEYTPDKKILNKFDVFTEIFVTPLPLLLSQKLYASTNRKRAKGRDFYDIVFLYTLTQPDYAYLNYRWGVTDATTLRAKISTDIQELDFKLLADDVRPFLFNPNDAKKVELFREFMQQQ